MRVMMAQVIGKNCFLGRELSKEWGLTENYFERSQARKQIFGTWYYNFECQIIDGLAFVKFSDEITAMILNKDIVGTRVNKKINNADFLKIINLSDDTKIGFYKV